MGDPAAYAKKALIDRTGYYTMKDQCYAHSLEGKPSEDWHRLDDHLNEVAKMALSFANDFNAGDWAYLAGFMV